MKCCRFILVVFFLCGNLIAFSQDSNTTAYYYFWNRYQDKGMVMAKANTNHAAIMVQRINYDGALWQLEPGEDGSFFIKNVALNTNGYLYTEKGDRMFFSKKKNNPAYMWQFNEAEDGLIIINKKLGNNFVLDCDSDTTGGILFISEKTGAGGQFWVAEKVKKLAVTITSIRMFQNKVFLKEDYKYSTTEAIRRLLEANGTIIFNAETSPKINTTSILIIEYVINNKIHTKKYRYGDIINLETF